MASRGAHRASRPLSLPAVAAALALLAACAGTAKRLEQGRALEAGGRPAEAALRYAEVLQRDSLNQEAREGLKRMGDEAVRQGLEAAAAHEAATRLDDALDALDRLDLVRVRAQALRVPLPVPTDYPERRKALYHRAVEGALAQARQALAERRWAGALQPLDRARERYHPTVNQGAAVDSLRWEAEWGWAAEAMDAGEFRLAFTHATSAAEIYRDGAPRRDSAAALATLARERGTVEMTLLPVAVERGGPAVAAAVGRAVDARLGAEDWSRADPFIRLASSPRPGSEEAAGDGRKARTTRAGRRPLRSTRDAGSARQAGARVARRGATLRVSVRLEGIRRLRETGEPRRRRVRTRAGRDTAMLVRETREVLEMQVAYEVTSAMGGGVVGEGRFPVRVTRAQGSATYAGDPAQLRLADRAMVRGGQRQESRGVDEVLANRAVDELVPRLTHEIRTVLFRQIR